MMPADLAALDSQQTATSVQYDRNSRPSSSSRCISARFAADTLALVRRRRRPADAEERRVFVNASLWLRSIIGLRSEIRPCQARNILAYPASAFNDRTIAQLAEQFDPPCQSDHLHGRSDFVLEGSQATFPLKLGVFRARLFNFSADLQPKQTCGRRSFGKRGRDGGDLKMTGKAMPARHLL
jgi:hypothetical protein